MQTNDDRTLDVFLFKEARELISDTLPSINVRTAPVRLSHDLVCVCAHLSSKHHPANIFFLRSLSSVIRLSVWWLTVSQKNVKNVRRKIKRERDSIRSHSSLPHVICDPCLSCIGGEEEGESVLSSARAWHAVMCFQDQRSCDIAANALLCLTVHNSTRQRQCTIVRSPHFTVLTLPT